MGLNFKEKYQISFSGGRTSAYMTKKLIDNYSDIYDFIVTFANTGREHEKTLEFINNCDKYFNFNTVWLEAVVHEERKAPTHRIVNFETACRDGSVFEEVIKKYGIPNVSFPGCTRDLKLSPMRSYLNSLGISETKIKTAIGIRHDEQRRVNKNTARDKNLEYPLVDIWPTDKGMIINWRKKQQFDLGIQEFEGNCLCCFKKSYKKQFMQIEKNRESFDWCRKMEKKYMETGPQKGIRVFFRGNLDTQGLFQLYKETKLENMQYDFFEDENGGCSESCEFLEMEV